MSDLHACPICRENRCHKFEWFDGEESITGVRCPSCRTEMRLFYFDFFCGAMDMLYEEVEHLRAELERAKLESPWVYCRDRMPEDEDVVLWRTRSIINPVVCAPINLLGERDEVVKIFGFTHWMPIPELPDQPPPLPETEG